MMRATQALLAPRTPLVVVVVVAAAVACATYGDVPEAPAWDKPGVRVLDVDHPATAAAWAGPATYTVRSVSSGAVVERVVAVPGVGEIHVGLAGDDAACRFVWSKGGLDRLVLYSARACAERGEGRVCFHHASFRADAADPTAPRALVVDGCADENDLLWSKVDGAQPATVGPSNFRQRCARVPRKKGCELTYLKRDAVAVESNAAADAGFSFVFDGEGWRACFLEKEAGPYRVVLDVEDDCGARRPVELRGDSAELDD